MSIKIQKCQVLLKYLLNKLENSEEPDMFWLFSNKNLNQD